MTDALSALNAFFSGFGLRAYSKDNVPDGARMPYITYEAVVPAPMRRSLLHAWIWYRGDDLAPVAAKADTIHAAIQNGAALKALTGAVYLFPDSRTPFAQEQPDPNRNVRVMYLTMAMVNNTI